MIRKGDNKLLVVQAGPTTAEAAVQAGASGCDKCKVPTTTQDLDCILGIVQACQPGSRLFHRLNQQGGKNKTCELQEICCTMGGLDAQIVETTVVDEAMLHSWKDKLANVRELVQATAAHSASQLNASKQTPQTPSHTTWCHWVASCILALTCAAVMVWASGSISWRIWVATMAASLMGHLVALILMSDLLGR